MNIETFACAPLDWTFDVAVAHADGSQLELRVNDEYGTTVTTQSCTGSDTHTVPAATPADSNRDHVVQWSTASGCFDSTVDCALGGCSWAHEASVAGGRDQALSLRCGPSEPCWDGPGSPRGLLICAGSVILGPSGGLGVAPAEGDDEMERLLRTQLMVAMSLVAGACADKGPGETGDASSGQPGEGATGPSSPPRYAGDYGACDPEETDALPLLWLEAVEAGNPDSVVVTAESDLLEYGSDTLCCLDKVVDETACLADPAPTAHEECRTAIRDRWEGHWWQPKTECGPVWLGEACCLHQSWDLEDVGDEGRPFLVQRQRRQAGPAPRADWRAELCPAPVPETVRAAVVARWVAAGRAEHASVASFARFSMALLHHGAPADLVRDAHAAALDEVRHTEACFALASAIGGAPVGPGALDVSGSLAGELGLAQMTRTLVAEGCVGETLAALEAAEAARRALDPVVRRVLEGVADDEARHAALAWRTLLWLLTIHPELRTVAVAALATAKPGWPAGPAGLEAHGCLSAATRLEVRRIGLGTVVARLAQEAVGAPGRAEAWA